MCKFASAVSCIILSLGWSTPSKAQVFYPYDWSSLLIKSTYTLADFTRTAIYSNHITIDGSSMFTMKDQTISWTQPDDPAYGGYNGRCGEVAAANILSMIDTTTSPAQVARSMSDITPGTHPKTLHRYFEAHAPGDWILATSTYKHAEYHLRKYLGEGELKAPNNKAPIAALIQLAQSSLHWVSIVDLTDDGSVVFNDSGTQTKVPLSVFIKHWAFDAADYGTKVGLKSLCCQPFSMILQNPL